MESALERGMDRHMNSGNGISGAIRKFRSEVFSSEECNLGRQKELDIGKALPILGLAFVHCIIECCTEAQLYFGIPLLFDSVIGGPMSAPMFTFCMGATVHYSKLKTTKQIAQRGLALLLTGFVLNICRFLIPFSIGYLITGNVEKYLVPLPYFVFGNDILQFAGLFFLCLALFKRLKTPKWLMAGISLAMAIAGSLLRHTDMGNDVLNIIFGWFIGTVNEANQIVSDFPLLNWLIIPVCGYIFGSFLRHMKDKRRFYRTFSPILLLLAVAIIGYELRAEVGMFDDGQNAYYHILTHDAILSIMLTLGLLGVYYGLSKLLPRRIMGFFSYTSRHITEFYCIHWVLVRFITNVVLYVALGTQLIPVWETLLIGLGIVLFTYLSLFVYDRLKALKRKSAA